MFGLTIQDNHLGCRKQLRESFHLPEVLQKVREFMCLVYTEKHKCLIINGYHFEGGHYSFLD